MNNELDYMVSDAGETERLIIRNSVLEECEKLQRINEASDYISNWVGWKTPSKYAYLTLTQGNLPPNGDKKYFKAKTIYLKQTNEVIGVLELYNGYPSRDVLSIGWLFIHPEHQKMGYAKETVNYVFEEARRAHFKKIRLGVHLKNWPAIRFWHKNGFDKIVNIVGDDVHSDNTFASIILEKSVK